jgi:anaerobic selenocysteine-containing dehydrogenase
MPTAALADEMLLSGKGRVRALISVAGNPVTAWPDQLRVLEGLKKLDLLVQVDPWMSQTARLAHFVLAPKMAYEVPGLTLTVDTAIAMSTYYGPGESYAQHTPAVAAPPAGSDLLAEWEFLYGIARRMGLTLRLARFDVSGTDSGFIDIDMRRPPTDERLLELLSTGARVALEQVKQHPSGAAFPAPVVTVLPKDAGSTARFDLANVDMMTELDSLAASTRGSVSTAARARPFMLIGRRVQHMINSVGNTSLTNRGRGYNPAWLHPEDLQLLGLTAGDEIDVASDRASIRAVALPDDSLRRGLVAMTHGFGDGPHRDGELLTIGSPTGRLIDLDDVVDRYVGMPRMGGIAVSVGPRPASTSATAAEA